MPEPLPLFPLGTVLLPGLVLPLRVFEERYRTLVRDLLDLPEGVPRRFGVVAIRAGSEVGARAARDLFEVGCTAEVRQVEAIDDGRFSLVTGGGRRFALRGVDAESRPYLVGRVDPLPDRVGSGEEAARLVEAVHPAFLEYQAAVAAARGQPVPAPELPRDPLTVSYLVAASVLVDVVDTQALLAAPDAVARLRAELALLDRELGLLRRVAAVPAPELRHVRQSLN